MDNQASPSIESPKNDTGRQSWTAGQTAVIILLVIICWVLVWNAYTPEDIYVSDLEYEVMVGDKFDPRNDQTVDGNTLQVHRSFYPKGIGVHANSEIFLRFVPEGYTYFVAEIGMDANHEDSNQGSVVFSVYGGGAEGRLGTEGTLLYESPVMKPGMNPRLVYVPVKGMRSLTLAVTDGGDGNQDDYAIWALARFIKE